MEFFTSCAIIGATGIALAGGIEFLVRITEGILWK